MTIQKDSETRAVAGRCFEDILDGYFPLSESLRQMLERHAFEAMWVTLIYAPVMNICGLPATAPVPMHVPKHYSGMIDFMTISVRRSDAGIELAGVGNWFWVDGRAETGTFTPSTRLGEPAFVRGIGIDSLHRDADRAAGVALARSGSPVLRGDELAQAIQGLGWQEGRAWMLEGRNTGIHQVNSEEAEESILGDKSLLPGNADTKRLPVDPTWGQWNCLLVDVSPDRADREALELARRL